MGSPGQPERVNRTLSFANGFHKVRNSCEISSTWVPQATCFLFGEKFQPNCHSHQTLRDSGRFGPLDPPRLRPPLPVALTLCVQSMCSCDSTTSDSETHGKTPIFSVLLGRPKRPASFLEQKIQTLRDSRTSAPLTPRCPPPVDRPGVTGPEHDQDHSMTILLGHFRTTARRWKILRSCPGPETPGRWRPHPLRAVGVLLDVEPHALEGRRHLLDVAARPPEVAQHVVDDDGVTQVTPLHLVRLVLQNYKRQVRQTENVRVDVESHPIGISTLLIQFLHLHKNIPCPIGSVYQCQEKPIPPIQKLKV